MGRINRFISRHGLRATEMGLAMAGPLEKPVRLDDLEALLTSLKPGLVP